MVILAQCYIFENRGVFMVYLFYLLSFLLIAGIGLIIAGYITQNKRMRKAGNRLALITFIVLVFIIIINTPVNITSN